MADISEAAGLSRIYTNHRVRAAAITLWSNAGITNHHILAISGHQNEQSLVHYNQSRSSLQLHYCSDVSCVLHTSLMHYNSIKAPTHPLFLK